MRRILAVVLLVFAGLVAAPAAHAAAPSMTRCALGIGRPTWCGTMRAPLDYGDPRSGTIAIGYGWTPASGPADGTIVAMEGGPGYPSTGTAPDFAEMFGSLLEHRNLLVVDARGTGRSTPLDCEPLQSLPAPSPRFTDAVTACGRQLNHTFPRAGGGYVHASDLFSTANTARDVAGVISLLGLGKVDLYGDSYGTYFAQSFLARYPQLLRSVVLDSAYEARDLDPWYRTTVTTARAAFDAVCARAAGCAAGSSWQRIGALAARLRAHPVSGTAVGTDARRHTVTVGVRELVNIVNDAGYDSDPYRQLDAAARAYLQQGDATPLLRLYLQDVGWDYSDYVGTPASYYSDGLYMAVACTDYPQLFDVNATPAVRARQLDAAIDALPASTFAPFTTREWLQVLPYTETYSGCLTWPRPTHPYDPPVPAGAFNPTHVPVLVMNGELDSLTPAAGGAHITRQLGPSAQHVVTANTVHLVALDNPHACGPGLVRAFVAAPAAPLDTSCAATIPPIRAVPRFPATLAQALPAAGAAPLRTRLLASVAAAAAGDAVNRFDYVDGLADLGLRGGRVAYSPAGDARLTDVRWTSDTTVSGTVRHTASGAIAGRVTITPPSGAIAGRVTITPPSGAPVVVTLSWGSGGSATATVDGLALTVPAP